LIASRSSVKLPLLQPTPITLFRHLPARHLDIRRLHVLLRQFRADFLVGLGVGFLAVARAVKHAFARDARLETRVVRVGRGFWGGAFCAGWCGSCGSLWDGAWAWVQKKSGIRAWAAGGWYEEICTHLARSRPCLWSDVVFGTGSSLPTCISKPAIAICDEAFQVLMPEASFEVKSHVMGVNFEIYGSNLEQSIKPNGNLGISY
jgi:hypothetical protein